MPSKEIIDQTFLRIAREIANFSNCVSFNVGCVIVKDGRIISMGYNGTPKGFQNCSERFPNLIERPRKTWSTDERDEHHAFSEAHEIHAEENAINFAARHGLSIEGSDVYCTLQPCNRCLKMLCAPGIKRIIYSEEYDKCNHCSEVREMVINSGIKLEWIPLK